MRKSGFQYEAQIFEHRRTLITTKRKLGLRGDDEDLVYYKVCIGNYRCVLRTGTDSKLQPKKRVADPTVPATVRIPIRQDGKPAEADLRQLSGVKLDAEKAYTERYLELRNSRAVPKYNVVDLTGVCPSLRRIAQGMISILTLLLGCAI